jgi:hypothetical protein
MPEDWVYYSETRPNPCTCQGFYNTRYYITYDVKAASSDVLSAQL